MTNKSKHFGGLDLVRFFAAFSVLLFHLGVTSWASPVGLNFSLPSAPKYPEFKFFSIGWVGVEIFFVLSGLVIAQSAEGKYAYKFLRGRVGRLVPAVWITAALTTTTVLYFGIKQSSGALADFGRTLIFAPNGPWVSGVYWTLQVEIVFYALIFILLSLGLFHRIEIVATALGIFSAIYVIGHSFFGFPHMSGHSLLQHGCFFCLGIFIWLISAKGGSRFRYAVCAFIIPVGIVEIDYLVLDNLSVYEKVAAPTLWLLSIAAISLSTARPIAAGLFVRKLGLMTYPLYLVHNTMGCVLLRISPWTGKYLAFVIATSVVVAFSWVVVEIEPMLRKCIEATCDTLASFFAPQWYSRSITPADQIPPTPT